MPNAVTAPLIFQKKAKGEKVVCVTAYDSCFALLADEAGVDIILVGDSVGNVMLGYSSTVPVTMTDMLHHVRAVAGATHNALVVGDLPFGSYQEGVEQAVRNSVFLMQAGAGAVKLEGAYTDQVEAIVRAGIPVMGHIGMTPQSVHKFGGHKIQGKGDEADRVVAEALALDKAGCFAIVLELIPSDLAMRISEAVLCPTIGIGAGPDCDGQVQVMHDMLGLSPRHFRHAKRYVETGTLVREAFSKYSDDVRSKTFSTG